MSCQPRPGPGGCGQTSHAVEPTTNRYPIRPDSSVSGAEIHSGHKRKSQRIRREWRFRAEAGAMRDEAHGWTWMPVAAPMPTHREDAVGVVGRCVPTVPWLRKEQRMAVGFKREGARRRRRRRRHRRSILPIGHRIAPPPSPPLHYGRPSSCVPLLLDGPRARRGESSTSRGPCLALAKNTACGVFSSWAAPPATVTPMGSDATWSDQ